MAHSPAASGIFPIFVLCAIPILAYQDASTNAAGGRYRDDGGRETSAKAK